ncbi:glutamate 5-kinase [Neptunicella marina]|uniref:Glutamate 5-kinase n=1 Tax=Neptunicella marina TaxID=2125989 RepID=A0A8J6IWU5_9ALTE|nr:glutamate 5-kinase [Neptunicella marina]MBC3766828.1 glutamate 5-kinase [Neptunicella marina]
MSQQQLNWQRAVIKVGSALIAPEGNGCKTEYLLALARFIIQSRKQGKEIVLVSSGSVAAGRNSIASSGQTSIAEKQAMAAVGQTRMMANWARLFDFPCAQILLTHDDLGDRQRFLNAKNTLRELLKNDVLPIINENDSVVTDELKFGDNDNLAALVTLVSDADTLIICTDVDGLYDSDPKANKNAKLLKQVEHISDEIMVLAGDSKSLVGTGGMQSKLRAARKACEQGIQTLIVNGRNSDVFTQLAEGANPGTLFNAHSSRQKAKKNWLKNGLKTKGSIKVDSGAYNALVERGASLLPAGVLAVEGRFEAGYAVQIEYHDKPVAVGLALYNAAEIRKLKGQKSTHIESILGYHNQDVVVHRDDLVLL